MISIILESMLPVGLTSSSVFSEQEEALCTNFDSGKGICTTGCNPVGVSKNDLCPYQPTNIQSKCPCYKAG